MASTSFLYSSSVLLFLVLLVVASAADYSYSATPKTVKPQPNNVYTSTPDYNDGAKPKSLDVDFKSEVNVEYVPKPKLEAPKKPTVDYASKPELETPKKTTNKYVQKPELETPKKPTDEYVSKPEVETPKMPNDGYVPKPEVQIPKMPTDEYTKPKLDAPKMPTGEYIPKPKLDAPKMPTDEYVPKPTIETPKKPTDEYVTKPTLETPKIPTDKYVPKKPTDEYVPKPTLETPKKPTDMYVPKPELETPKRPNDEYVPKLEIPLPIGIEGLILCKSGSKYIPIKGAVARITCSVLGHNGYETAPFSCLTSATDAKGFFFKTLSDLRVNQILQLTDCRVKLEKSPLKSCNIATNVNKGITGALLSSYQILHDRKIKLYPVGPFFYTSDDTQSTSTPTGY